LTDSGKSVDTAAHNFGARQYIPIFNLVCFRTKIKPFSEFILYLCCCEKTEKQLSGFGNRFLNSNRNSGFPGSKYPFLLFRKKRMAQER